MINAGSNKKTSQLLIQLMDGLPEGQVKLDEIMKPLRRRSFGGVLIMLAVVGLVPGISLIVGLFMIVPALQLLAGRKVPVFPKFMRGKDLPVQKVKSVVSRLIPWLERLERLIVPRWPLLTEFPFTSVVGLIVLFLAMVIMLPLPFSNFPPAIALVCLSLGLLQRDGMMILIGIGIAIIAFVIGVTIVVTAFDAIQNFMG